MPLSQFHQILPKGTHETAQTKMATYSPDLSPFMPDQEYVELLWENGQVVMQGQSNRMKKSFFADTLPSHTGRFQERDCRNAVNPKSGHFGASTDSAANEFAHSVPSAPVGLNSQVDDMAPWINYQMEDSLQNDYCSDFLSEFSAANLNPFPAHNNAVPADRSTGITHIIRDSYNDEHEHAPKTLPGGSESSRIRTDHLFQLPQSSLLNARSKASEYGISTSTQLGSCENLQDKSLQKKDVIKSKLPNASTSLRLTNFPHFLRPAALVRSNIQTVDRLRSNEKASTTNSSNNPVASTVINTAGAGYLNHLSEKQGQSTPAPPTVELKKSAKPLHEVISVGKPDAGCRDDTSTNKHISVVSNANTRPSEQINCQTSAAMTGIRHEVEKNPEAVVASSVCSVNSVGAESNDHKQTTKRKNREIEESGYQSEDLEDESVGLKKLANARSMNAKRSRAAEVHNLSERRRRDRINEKMRALQELIPNCNKVDKASMLDEAIEYLKTLQLQVQFMSMGSGLCMPPMMLPAAMQHLRPHPMTHFSPMGISMGMGMGFGYGMGMVDVNGASGCPLIPVPPMHHGPQFPCSSVPGAPILHGIPGPTSLPMFGMPGQGIPMPMPRAPFGSLSGHPAKVLPTATGPLPTADVAPLTNSVDQDQHDVKRETNPCALNSQILTSTQMNNQVVHTSGN